MRIASTTLRSGAQAGASDWKLGMYAIAILVIAETIGTLTFRIGRGQIVLSPMIWAMIMGAVAGAVQKYLGPLSLTLPLQFRAALVLQPVLLLLVAKWGLMVGSLVPRIAGMGWALLCQQLGHAVGTVLIGLPVALLLGLRRDAIGASIAAGREASLSIIGERYGMHSPEGRGVLAGYVTAALLGTLFISVFADFVASLHIFHPAALAMGAGIGSGSMMAAAIGAIAAQQTPQLAQEVIGVATISNLLNTIVGTYCTLFVSLPLAAWLYRVLEPVIGSGAVTPRRRDVSGMFSESDRLHFAGRIGACLFVGLLAIVANWIGYRVSPQESAICICLMLAAVVVAEVVHALSGKRVSAVLWVTLVAMFLTSPACPWAGTIADAAGKISVAAIVTPVLTFAGLSMAKDIPELCTLGWRLVMTSLAALAGTFICATVIAQLFYS